MRPAPSAKVHFLLSVIDVMNFSNLMISEKLPKLVTFWLARNVKYLSVPTVNTSNGMKKSTVLEIILANALIATLRARNV